MSKTHDYTLLPNKTIVNYWTQRIDECDLNVDWSEAHEQCWSCADKCELQHCHIIPHALGGKYEPANIVLLCNQCHKENPNTTNPDLYWNWLKSRKSLSHYGLYGTYWTRKILTEYQTIYKSDAIKDLSEVIFDGSNFLEEHFPAFISDKFVMDGQRHSPSTMATLLREFILNLRNVLQSENDSDNIVRFEGQ